MPSRKTAKAWSTNLGLDGDSNDPAALDGGRVTARFRISNQLVLGSTGTCLHFLQSVLQ